MTQMSRRVSRALRLAVVCACVIVIFAVLLAATYDPKLSGGYPQQLRESLLIALFIATPACVAAAIVISARWGRLAALSSTRDGPARLLAVAVGALPGDRTEWAAAMEAELARVDGRRARWWFAVSAARAAVFPPPSSPLPIRVASGAAVVLVVATALTVGSELPTLHLFAVTFTALASTVAVVTVARGCRIAPSPALAAIVGAAVTGCIATTTYVLADHRSAGAALRPVPAVLLAVVLTGGLWLALAPPGALMTSRTARWIGVAHGFALGIGFLWFTGFPHDRGEGAIGFVLFCTIGMFFLVSWVAALIDKSFQSGVQAAVWGATVGLPLIFIIWLTQVLRKFDAGAGLLLDGDVPPNAVNLITANFSDAVFWDFVLISIWALPFGIFGAAAGRDIAAPEPAAGRDHARA
jgi:hypothetical protein